MLTGRDIFVEGTLVPSSHDEFVILVDDVRHAGVAGPVEKTHVWLVTVPQADGTKLLLPYPGTYELYIPLGAEGEEKQLLLIDLHRIRVLEPAQHSEMERYIGRLDRRKFMEAHGGTVYVQFCLEQLGTEGLAPNKFTYPPLWATIEPGMTLERHHHPFPEFYVFTNGAGTMKLGEEEFTVQKDTAVFIPSDEWHTVSNSDTASEPLTWLSIGLKPQP
jgi:mannose-6-phosphate isomerase-like protein (cupin superfamily)